MLQHSVGYPLMASAQLHDGVARPRTIKHHRPTGGYFCQVRFLWRLARSCLRRLCLLIFDLRRFFSDPIFCVSGSAQYTTLFNGYSMIPSAPAAFNCGINSRTTCSSMIVSTATHPSRLRLDTVG